MYALVLLFKLNVMSKTNRIPKTKTHSSSLLPDQYFIYYGFPVIIDAFVVGVVMYILISLFLFPFSACH